MAKKDEKITVNDEATNVIEAVEAAPETFCYIGPSLPGAALKQNATLIGTRAEIKARYAEEIEKYPQILKLIVKVEDLADAKIKLAQGANTLKKSYTDMVAIIAAEAE